MTLSRRQLTSEFVAAIHNRNAALFVGAGMSRASGFVDWKGLLKGCAEEIGLDLDREFDLVAVAQYYLNLGPGNRWNLNRLLRTEFDRDSAPNANHDIIGRLPVSTLWTTNFDTLLEQGLAKAHRRVDVKSKDADITHPKNRCDVTLYKMHGDIANPEEIVICKADYERYARQHELFQTTLEADLASKTFLFLGFSFADPNLNYMLGHLHTMLEGAGHQHFAILRRARQNFSLGEDCARVFDYERNKQDLQVRELERYNIRTLLIDQFQEVTETLQEIEAAALRRNIFVSGSAHQFAAGFDEGRMRDLCMHLGEMMMERDHRLVSGFGLNIGESVIKGALLKLYERKDTGIEDHFLLRPFPRSLPPHMDEQEFLEDYRRRMISKAGFAVFIAGTSRSSAISAGVLEEYRIARELKKIPIPIGATGFAAADIWHRVREEREAVYGGRVPEALYERLNDSTLSNEELLRSVFDIVQAFDAV